MIYITLVNCQLQFQSLITREVTTACIYYNNRAAAKVQSKQKAAKILGILNWV